MAHEHKAIVHWDRDGAAFANNRYSRGHSWSFDGGIEVLASASPSVVPLPFSREDAVDPEEAFVAAVASCHMLSFLWVAAKKRFIVDSYKDEAVGVLSPNERGKLFVSRITLNPAIAFSGDAVPTPDETAEMHHLAHEECYIANSVRTDIVVAGLPSH